MSNCIHDFIQEMSVRKICTQCGKPEIEILREEHADYLAKATTAEEEIDHLEIVADSKVDVSRHMEVLKERDEYKAHTALLVGALENARNYIHVNRPEAIGTREELREQTAIFECVNKALSATPSEAYKRVQGLVTALEEIMARCEIPKSKDDAHYENYYEAQAALQRYKGAKP